MKSQPWRYSVQKVFFKFNSLFLVLTFSNNMSITQVRVSEEKSLKRPLKPPQLHDMIISPHVKHLPINLPKNACSPMQSFFAKKVPPGFIGGEETLCSIFISLPISKSFIPNFCGTNYDLSSKTNQSLVLKSYSMVLKFSKLF